MKSFCVIVVSVFPLFSMAVEYELDGPLDLKQSWIFLRDERFFLQHQCKVKSGNAWGEKIKNLMEKHAVTFNKEEAIIPLQIRMFSTAEHYRRTFKFSKDRHGHYNSHLILLTTYCGVSAQLFEEQLLLYQLSETTLRPWQKIFIAEILPYLSSEYSLDPFPDSVKTKPLPLTYILLSNHNPEKPERATMRQLALFLWKKGKLGGFISQLLQMQGFDDTGMEILENMFSEDIKVLEEKLAP